MKQLAKIYIHNISIKGIFGAYEEERTKPQTIFVSLELSIDAAKSIASDHLEDTVNYDLLYQKIRKEISTSEFYLIESVASAVLDICLSESGILGALVRVEKPHILEHAKGVVLEMKRGEI